MVPPFVCPEPLSAGSVVRVIRPAGAFDAGALRLGLGIIEGMGLRAQMPADDWGDAPAHYYAGSVAERSHDVVTALTHASVQALWAVRGGSGTAQLLPHIEQALQHRLAKKPLWLIGFSDITALHGRFNRAGIMSVHGANVTTLPSWSLDAQRQLSAWLGGTSAAAAHGDYACSAMLEVHDAPVVEGPIVGGNLTVLASLCGTPAQVNAAGCLLFLEDIDERPYRLDRCLQQLYQAGALNGVRAVVFGQLTRCDAPSREGRGYSALELLAPTLHQLGVPVVFGVPVGHEPESRPLLLGGMAHLDVRAGMLRVRP